MQKNHREIAFPEFIKWIDTLDLAGKRVLEIGPGASREFRAEFEKRGAEWTGLDKDYQDKDVYKGSMENIPFPDKFFDYAFACHSFEHSTHPFLTLLQLKQKVKKEFMLITPYHCRHQVLDGDFTHLFVLTDMQMERLFLASAIPKIDIYVQKDDPLEQNYNLISIGGYK
jgi:hypothetical protein